MFRLTTLLVLSFATSACTAQSATLSLAPGLTIPDGKTPWAVDHFQEQVEIVPIHHSEVKINNHPGANLAGALTQSFFYKPKATTDLLGITTKTIVHDTLPSFYFHIEDEGFDSLASFALVSAKVENDHRIYSTVRYTQLSSKAKRDDNQIECKLEQLDGGWARLTPVQPLVPGEYALTPLFKNPKLFALVVYDFSVNAKAANANDAILQSSK